MSTSLIRTHLQLPLGGVTIDLMVTVSEYGWIEDLRIIYFDLPASAQRLMAGSEKKFDQRVRALATGVQPALLYLMMGHPLERGPYVSVKALANQLLTSLRAEGVIWRLLPAVLYPNETFAWYHRSLINRNAAGKILGVSRFATHLKALLVAADTDGQLLAVHQAVRIIGRTGQSYGAELLCGIEVLYADSMRSLIMSNLNYYPTPTTRAYLLDRLDDSKNRAYLSGVVCALKKYQDIDIAVRMIRLYHEKKLFLDGLTKSCLCIILKSHRSEQIKDILLTVFNQLEPVSAKSACRALISQGYPQQKLMDYLLPRLTGSNAEKTTNALTVAVLIDDAFYPDGDTLWIAYHKSRRQYNGTRISYLMPLLLRHRRVTDFHQKLRAGLTDKDTNVQTGFLELLKETDLFQTQGIKQTDEDLTEVVCQLVGSPRGLVSQTAASVLGCLPYNDITPARIDALTRIYEKADGREDTQVALLNSFISLLKNQLITPPPAWEEIALRAIQHSDSRYVFSAIEILHYYTSAAAVAKLAAARHSADKGIAAAAISYPTITRHVPPPKKKSPPPPPPKKTIDITHAKPTTAPAEPVKPNWRRRVWRWLTE